MPVADTIPPPREVPPRKQLASDDGIDGKLALEGRKLFLKLQCIRCHTSTAEAKAPTLERLYGTKVALKDGGIVDADEAYIVESIRKPRAKVVEGWEAIMPAYDSEQATDEEVKALVAFIKSLKPGDLKSKEERFPPPVGAPVERPKERPPARKVNHAFFASIRSFPTHGRSTSGITTEPSACW
jgi:cytochrome c oxidase subunit 2